MLICILGPTLIKKKGKSPSLGLETFEPNESTRITKISAFSFVPHSYNTLLPSFCFIRFIQNKQQTLENKTLTSISNSDGRKKRRFVCCSTFLLIDECKILVTSVRAWYFCIRLLSFSVSIYTSQFVYMLCVKAARG